MQSRRLIHRAQNLSSNVRNNHCHNFIEFIKCSRKISIYITKYQNQAHQ